MNNKKIKKDFGGMIYSTDSGFEFDNEAEETETLPPQQQKLMIRLETKQRGGKKATLIKGFIGKADDMDTLAKKIKNHCGTGGSITDGEILIQGDQVQKVKLFLQGLGYKTNNIWSKLAKKELAVGKGEIGNKQLAVGKKVAEWTKVNHENN